MMFLYIYISCDVMCSFLNESLYVKNLPKKIQAKSQRCKIARQSPRLCCLLYPPGQVENDFGVNGFRPWEISIRGFHGGFRGFPKKDMYLKENNDSQGSKC